ncbi:MAG: hypothetical protein ABWY45_09850 [Mycobacterium sp.]
MPENNSGDEAYSGATTAGRRQAGGSAGWIAPAALVVALVAAGVAVWSLMSKAPADESASEPQGPASEVTAEQSDAAKAKVCAAFDTVARAVQLQTFANLGPDPVALTAVAGNARLALLGGGIYLEGQVDEATPEDLGGKVSSFAITLQDIGINALTGVTNQDPVQMERLKEGDRIRQEIVPLCQ